MNHSNQIDSIVKVVQVSPDPEQARSVESIKTSLLDLAQTMLSRRESGEQWNKNQVDFAGALGLLFRAATVSDREILWTLCPDRLFGLGLLNSALPEAITCLCPNCSFRVAYIDHEPQLGFSTPDKGEHSISREELKLLGLLGGALAIASTGFNRALRLYTPMMDWLHFTTEKALVWGDLKDYLEN